jgi:hypothetical protein
MASAVKEPTGTGKVVEEAKAVFVLFEMLTPYLTSSYFTIWPAD